MKLPSKNQRLLRSVSVTALTVAGAFGLSTVAFAQEAGAEEDAIIVTGIRASLDNAVAAKKDNTSIVEVISAEDLGKLPDQSIAESLSRLPGLATQRLDGRANVVSIRGLAPDFTTTLLNGREQVSTNNNRGVELDQYPSELLSGALVYKTPNAKLVGQALGGTIDMQTIRPLAYGQSQLVIGARAEMNDLGKLNPDISDKGYRANIFYVDQNADETVGWAIGYARMQSPTAEERWNAWGYPDLNATTKVIGGAKPYVKSNKLTRDGLMAVLEVKPSETVHLTLDGYWSKFNDEQRLRGIELPLQWSGAQLQPGYTVTDGLVTSGQYNGVEAVMRNDIVNRDSDIKAIGFNAEFQVTDTFVFEADISHSRLKKTEENLEIYLGTGRGGGVGALDNLGFTMPAGGGVITFDPTIDYSDPNLFVITDPQGWNSCGGTLPNCQDGFVNRPRIKDRLSSIRLQATKTLDGFVESVEVGMNYSNRQKQLADEGYVLTHKNHPASTAVPADYLYDPVSLAFIGIPGMVAFDAWRYYNDGNYNLTNEALWTPGRLTNSYVVTEDVMTGYVQANFRSDTLKGNVGLQIVQTNQKGEGYAAFNDNGVTVSQGIMDRDSYVEFLPSLNASWEFTPDTFLRFGAARMLARPRMDQLNPGNGYSFDISKNIPGANINFTPWSGTAGNAKLRPLMATTFDAAIEKYFGAGAYVSIGAFYKKIDGWIYRQSDVFDFTGYATPNNDTPTFNQGLVSQWKNGSRNGKVYGGEASFSLPFSVVTPGLDGFGITGAASYTKSRVYEGGAAPITMPGLSRWVVNGSVYYEKNGFQVRGSARYRSSFLAEVAGLSLAREKIQARAEMVVDAQIGYTFQSGPLEGLGILLQGSNLTNEPFVTYYNNDVRQVRDYQSYGRNFMVGFTYKF